MGVFKEELSKYGISEHFDKVLSKTIIRVDQTDENSKFLNPVFTENRETNKGKLDGGLTKSIIIEGNQYIFMLIPNLAPALDNILNTHKVSSNDMDLVHTFIHEFVHALAKRENANGINYHNDIIENGERVDLYRGLVDDLDEGITEYVTRDIYKKLFPNIAIENRYPCRVKLVKELMDLTNIPNEDFIKYYISGRADKITDIFKEHIVYDTQGCRWDLLTALDYMHAKGDKFHIDEGPYIGKNKEHLDRMVRMINYTKQISQQQAVEE